jgi:peroxiredoxin
MLIAGMLGGTLLALAPNAPTELSPSEQAPPAEPTAVAANSFSQAGQANDSGFGALTLLKPGTWPPNFSAKDATGHPVSLSQFKGKHPVIIAFYQGVFCSVCAHQLESVQAQLGTFKQHGIEVLAVSADEPADALKRQAESGLSFPVIADPQRKVIEAFGAANRTRHNIAYPTVYFINKEGKVAFAFADAMMMRMEASQMLQKAKALGWF